MKGLTQLFQIDNQERNQNEGNDLVLSKLHEKFDITLDFKPINYLNLNVVQFHNFLNQNETALKLEYNDEVFKRMSDFAKELPYQTYEKQLEKCNDLISCIPKGQNLLIYEPLLELITTIKNIQALLLPTPIVFSDQISLDEPTPKNVVWITCGIWGHVLYNFVTDSYEYSTLLHPDVTEAFLDAIKKIIQENENLFLSLKTEVGTKIRG